MTPSTTKMISDLGLDPKDFTEELPANLMGHTVLVNPYDFGKSSDKCLFKAINGFGCYAYLIGTCVFAERLSDKQTGRIDRGDIIAVKVQPTTPQVNPLTKPEIVIASGLAIFAGLCALTTVVLDALIIFGYP